MSGKWKGSQRRHRLPKNWRALVEAVHRRSGMRCEFVLPSGNRCPRAADGGVDHIIPNDDHSMSNLRDSCHHHHGRKSSAEGAAAKARFNRPVNDPEEHPRRRG